MLTCRFTYLHKFFIGFTSYNYAGRSKSFIFWAITTAQQALRYAWAHYHVEIPTPLASIFLCSLINVCLRYLSTRHCSFPWFPQIIWCPQADQPFEQKIPSKPLHFLYRALILISNVSIHSQIFYSGFLILFTNERSSCTWSTERTYFV